MPDDARIRTVDERRVRRPLTVADVEAMARAGTLGEDEHVELVRGELIVMPGEGALHIDTVTAIHRFLLASLPPQLYVHVRTPVTLVSTSQYEPDLSVFPKELHASQLTASACKLAVEVSVASLAYDLGEKARGYAEAGLEELWVADPIGCRIVVHRKPENGAWSSVVTSHAGESVAPLCSPAAFLPVSELPQE